MCETGCAMATRGKRKGAEISCEACCASSIGRQQRTKAFSKGSPWTTRKVAEKATNMQMKNEATIDPREISYGSTIATMQPLTFRVA